MCKRTESSYWIVVSVASHIDERTCHVNDFDNKNLFEKLWAGLLVLVGSEAQQVPLQHGHSDFTHWRNI